MKTYRVGVREVHVQVVEIQAESKEEALRLVYDGHGNGIEPSAYDYTLDMDTWTVRERTEE